jgi:hypothetical protein
MIAPPPENESRIKWSPRIAQVLPSTLISESVHGRAPNFCRFVHEATPQSGSDVPEYFHSVFDLKGRMFDCTVNFTSDLPSVGSVRSGKSV